MLEGDKCIEKQKKKMDQGIEMKWGAGREGHLLKLESINKLLPSKRLE